MTMVEFLEADRERLISELGSAGTAEKAETVITGEADRLLLLYNERCEMDERREAAAMMLQTARMAAPLVNTIGETKIWEEVTAGGSREKAKVPLLAKLSGLAGGICAISSFGMALFMTPDSLRATDVILALLLFAVSPVLIGLAGSLIGRSRALGAGGTGALGGSRALGAGGTGALGGSHALGAGRLSVSDGGRGGQGSGKAGYHVENRIDAKRTYTALRNMIIAVDQNLERITPAADYGMGEAYLSAEERMMDEEGKRSSGRKRSSGSAGSTGRTPDKAEIELFADLLEASLSQDGEYALEKLADIRFYLHRQQVETIFYDGSNRELFDFMPAAKEKTLRPALVKDGKVLKKGLASEGRA